MDQKEFETLLKAAIEGVHEQYAAQFKRLEDRVVQLEKTHSETVKQLSKRITQLGG